MAQHQAKVEEAIAQAKALKRAMLHGHVATQVSIHTSQLWQTPMWYPSIICVYEVTSLTVACYRFNVEHNGVLDIGAVTVHFTRPTHEYAVLLYNSVTSFKNIM